MTQVHHLINELGADHNGAEVVATSLDAGLRDLGWSSRLVALRSSGTRFEGFHALPHRSPYDPRAIRSIQRYLSAHARDGDILHVHLFPSNLLAAAAASLSRWRGYLVTTEHSTSNRRRGSALGRLVDRYTYQRYQRIFCISEATKHSLDRWNPGTADRTRVIENGVAITGDAPIRRATRDGPCVIVSMGRLHPVKNHEAALQALALLGDRDFEYRILGAGSLRGSLEARAAELGLGPRVRFLGHVDEPRRHLEEADVFLATSRWEGFGLAAVEAMNAGLPVVASDVPGLRSVVEGEGARLVPCEDPGAIAEALRALIDSETLRRRMGAAAFERSLRYSAGAMVSTYVREYEELTGCHRAR